MTKLWKVCCAALLAATLAAPAQAQDDDPFYCSIPIIGALLCGGGGGGSDVTQEDLDALEAALQAEIDAQAAQIAALQAQIGALQTADEANAAAIEALQGQIDDLEEQIAGLAALANCEINDQWESCNGDCAHLPSDPDHCGACFEACAPNENCVNGGCQLKTCPACTAGGVGPTSCQVPVLQNDGSCTCQFRPLVPQNGTAVCDDDNGCTGAASSRCVAGNCVFNPVIQIQPCTDGWPAGTTCTNNGGNAFTCNVP